MTMKFDKSLYFDYIWTPAIFGWQYRLEYRDNGGFAEYTYFSPNGDLVIEAWPYGDYPVSIHMSGMLYEGYGATLAAAFRYVLRDIKRDLKDEELSLLDGLASVRSRAKAIGLKL